SRLALSELLVARDAHLVLGAEERRRGGDRRGQVLRDHEHTVKIHAGVLVEVVVVRGESHAELTRPGAAVRTRRTGRECGERDLRALLHRFGLELGEVWDP